ncbi:MAG TPA: CidA/LrgA family protein [Bacteroidales bacterium]|nr:CidA/LrgA family protein [Bacteroidales bacterium]
MIKGSFYILFFYFLGELLSLLIKGFLPGSIIGMMLLFLSLFFKLLNPENVRATATAITKNMAVFFIPAAVGLMAYGELVSKNLTAIVLAISISTLLTIITVAMIQDKLEKHRKR